MIKYFYTDGIIKHGPFSKEELKGKPINRETKVWYYGIKKWIKIVDIEELKEVVNLIPPELKAQDKKVISNKNYNRSNYQKIVRPDVPNKKKKIKTFILIGLIILVSAFYINNVIKNQEEINLYNKILANSYDSDVDFQMYVDKFYRDVNIYGIFPKKPETSIIKFSKLDQLDNTTHIHGLSYGGNDDDKIEIYINPSTWESFSKPMRYFLMYHELAHDVLNVDDLEKTSINEGKLMYPALSSYDNKNMDDFIESYKALFEEQAAK